MSDEKIQAFFEKILITKKPISENEMNELDGIFKIRRKAFIQFFENHCRELEKGIEAEKKELK